MLENSDLYLNIDPIHATYSLESKKLPAKVTGARLGIAFRTEGQRFVAMKNEWPEARLLGEERVQSPHGTMRQVAVEGGLPEGLRYRVEFALVDNCPLCLVRMEIENRSARPLWIDRLELLDAGPGSLELGGGPGEIAFYSNGWQSWSFTGTYGRGERQRRTRLGPLRQPMVENAGTPRTRGKGHYSSDMYGVIGCRSERVGLLAGFLSQREQFGSLEAWTGPDPALRLWAGGDGARLDPGASMQTDWAAQTFVAIDDPDGLGHYLEAAARECPPPQLPETPTGWCSWYHFFDQIDEPAMHANLEAMATLRAKLPLGLFQIDDGYETQVGDWFSFKAGFAKGVAPLAREARERGFTPGLWLAPFMVSREARLVKEHPDWLLRDPRGRAVNSGAMARQFTNTALDMTHPGAADYVRRVIDTAVNAWGFSYLKLDFLYAAALPGARRDPSLTRAQVMRRALELIREASGPETFLMACSAPLGSALGLFQAARIGEDVAPEWEPQFHGVRWWIRDEVQYPAARNSLQNVLTRTALHRRWWINDPDCLLVRPDSSLTLAEVQTLATAIAMSGGSLLLSDDLPALPTDRLKIAQQLLPPVGKRARTVDWFDAVTPRRLRLDLEGAAGRWHLLALFNHGEKAEKTGLKLSDYHLEASPYWTAHSFWGQEGLAVNEGEVDLPAIPAHGVMLAAVREVRPGEAAYLGSNLHISQGLEVAAWEAAAGHVRLKLALPRQAEGAFTLALPDEPIGAGQDGKPLAWTAVGDGRYRFEASFERETEIEITTK